MHCTNEVAIFEVNIWRLVSPHRVIPNKRVNGMLIYLAASSIKLVNNSQPELNAGLPFLTYSIDRMNELSNLGRLSPLLAAKSAHMRHVGRSIRRMDG